MQFRTENGPCSRPEKVAARSGASFPDTGQLSDNQVPSSSPNEHHHIEDHALSVIDCDYLPELESIPFPPELALLIVRKAAAMAEAFESQALDQMTRVASRALCNGMEPRRIIRQMGL